MGLTFKKHLRSGRYSSFDAEWIDIKHNKKVVGHISGPSWKTEDNKWGITFARPTDKTEAKPAGWGWFNVTTRFEDEAAARKWIKDNTTTILSRPLHYFED